MDSLKTIFKKGSKTYYNSSIFFPKRERDDIYKLYAFVRTADNYVDAVPQQTNEFYEFINRYKSALTGVITNDIIIDGFVEIQIKYNFDLKWAEAFLKSMEMDLHKNVYNTIEELLEYVYGSAEVIGLFMSKILNLPEESYNAAAMQGRAMQIINFIRDINEDNDLGRRYIPLYDTTMKNLTQTEAENNPIEFTKLIHNAVNQYSQWQKTAETGYKYIPMKYLVPIKTASDAYNWTARIIKRNPFIIFKKKVKPSRFRIIFYIVRNFLIV